MKNIVKKIFKGLVATICTIIVFMVITAPFGSMYWNDKLAYCVAGSLVFLGMLKAAELAMVLWFEVFEKGDKDVE